MLQRRVGRLSPIFNQTMLINQSGIGSEYFRVDSIPEVLTSGKNLFKLRGNNRLLEPGSQVLVQVTDINNNAVYHHVNTFVDSAGRIVVSIYVYPETPPGPGKIQLLGIAKTRPDGRNVPPNWKDRYNIKFSREVVIRPDAINKTPIIFQRPPGLKIFENEREYLTQTYLAGSSIASQSVGSLNYTYSGFGDATITITGATFSSSMDGGFLRIDNPPFSLPSQYSLSSGSSLPPYESYISSVVNATTIKVDPYILDVEQTTQFMAANSAGSKGGGTVQTSTVQTAYPVPSFTGASYDIEWQQDAVYATGSTNSQSFASITLKNLDPIAGQVHKIKTYMKSAGFADFDLVSTQLLSQRDLLINVDSDLAFDRIGDYKSQEIINEYWASSSVNQPGLHPIVEHSDNIMISSLMISGSSLLSSSTNYPEEPLPDDPYIKVVSKPTNIELYKDNEYEVRFKVSCEAEVEGQVSSSYMEIYISGSGIPADDSRNIGKRLIKLETDNKAPTLVNSAASFIGLANLSNNLASPISIPAVSANVSKASTAIPATFPANAQAIQPTAPNLPDERQLEVSFTPITDTSAHLVFAAYRGRWYISDVSIQAAEDQGFTPNHTFFEIPIQTAQADDVLDFKFEFYNSQDEIANISLVTQSIDFVGSNLYISGNNNQLSGSVTIGGGIVMQGFSDG